MSKIIFSDNLPKWVGGKCYCPFPYVFGIGSCKIVIRPKYKNDVGLLEHELEHERQYKSDWFHAIKYYMSQKYRLECELLAYAKQIEVYGYKSLGQAMWIVKALDTKYRLDCGTGYLTKRVEELIKEGLR